jgi:DNA-binding NarL/FixJ family response regulator
VGRAANRSYDEFMIEEVENHEERVALTPRELEVLHMISFGMTNAEAARRLHVTVHAIKFHLAVIYRRLGVANRTEAAVKYLQMQNTNPAPRAPSD